MARKKRDYEDDFDDDDYDYDNDRPRRQVKKGMGWYGKFLLISLLLIASVVGFLVYRTYDMLTTGEKAVYTSPVQAKNNAPQGNVAVLTPQNSNDGTVSDLIIESGVEQLTPDENIAPDENAAPKDAAPIDPTNRSFDKDLDNLF
ncbi:MAG: hypothetical protein IKI11_07300 [Neisseriaceae bacterium]|nr:hypothetical protein [Neisseriaceae bacterium]